MARIRTIKPEFPQSESMGRVSREARLCFILLFTLADDAGRLRGNSRMLASLLYPYDDDAKNHIDGWLNDLHSNGCIQRYEVEGDQYIQICKWLIHQKIDKPSPSKIPAPTEDSITFAKPREHSVADQGEYLDQDRNGSLEEPYGSLSPAKLPDCPHQKILELWKTRCPMFAQPRVWDGARRAAMRARWIQAAKPSAYSPEGYKTEAEGLLWWDGFFEYIAESKLAKPFESKGRSWQADLEWVVNATNFQKIIDGKYDV
jgi:hypothetical protein